MNVCVKRPYTCCIFRSESLSGYTCMPVCNLPCLKGTLAVKIVFFSKHTYVREIWRDDCRFKEKHCTVIMPYFQGLLLGIAVGAEGVWRLEVVVVVPDGNARCRATRPSFPCPLPARQGLRRQRGPRRSRRLRRRRPLHPAPSLRRSFYSTGPWWIPPGHKRPP